MVGRFNVERSTVTIPKTLAVANFPEMLVHHKYDETDTFEDSLVYGVDTIRKEPPLNKTLYQFQGGTTVTYLGNHQWSFINKTSNKASLVKAIRSLHGK